MAEVERILAALGAVPKGAAPKTILSGDENQEPGYYQTDPLSNLVRVLKKRQLDFTANNKAKQEAMQKKADMYKTLRDAGYDTKSAYEAVIKNSIPEPGPEDASPKKTLREKILDKIAKGEALSTGEQQIYDDTIKKKSNDDLLSDALIPPGETDNQKRMREKILDKIANNKILTAGEQKIYDEVIKKNTPTKEKDTLDSVINDKEEKVPVISPEGVKGFVPKSKLAVALKAGYKKR